MNWISVKDRMPEKLYKILFHWTLEGQLKNMSMGYLCDDGWNIYLPYDSFRLTNDESICNVTHWIELPEYPKEKGE